MNDNHDEQYTPSKGEVKFIDLSDYKIEPLLLEDINVDNKPSTEVKDIENDDERQTLNNKDEEYIEDFVPYKIKIILVTSGKVSSTSFCKM